MSAPHPTLRYTLQQNPRRDAAAALQVVDEGIGAFNDAEPALADVAALAVFAHDEAGQVVGGAVGRSWGEAAELQQLWVVDERRHQGVGGELMRRFEQAALERGVKLVYLETFSFQAPAFYARLGYGEALRLSGMTRGISKFIMTKSLPAR